jgi:AcrR family transcriptional regulator
MRKVKRNPKLSKNAILDEAKKSFSQKGYRATTLEDLTKKFGTSKPSIYYYFKSKNEILSELHSIAFSQLSAGSKKILSSSDTIREKVRKILKNHATVTANNVEITKIFFQEQAEIPKRLRDNIRNKRKEYTDEIIELYREGMREGSFKEMDPRIASYLIIGSCNWISKWYSKKEEFDADYVVDCLMEILCFGYDTGKTKQTSNKEIEMKR